jgi:multisubunit Na+/H+ antiporter MnhF subunit
MVDVADLAPWYYAWAFSVPLIVMNLMIHIGGLVAIHASFTHALGRTANRPSVAARLIVMSMILTAVAALHALEGVVWAASYLIVGAVPDIRSAMLYSIEAITSYGHASVSLQPHWQMMGALEALNGMILFGLTTAFLFAMIQSSALLRRE